MDMDTGNGLVSRKKLGCNAIKSAGKLEYTPQAEGFAPFFFSFFFCALFESFRRKTYHGDMGEIFSGIY